MNFLAASIRVLLNYYQKPQTNLKILLTRTLKRQAETQRNSICRSVYGVVRHETALAHIIRLLEHSPGLKLDWECEIRLRLGVFLLLFSASYPDYAVVNEIVSSAPFKAKSYINGMLRRVCREKEQLRSTVLHNPDPTLRHSISPLLVDELSRISPNLEKDLAYLDQEPVFHLRSAHAVAALQQAEAVLKQAGISCRWLERFPTLEIARVSPLLPSRLNQAGIYLQNTGSQMVSIIAAAVAQKTVYDAAAAPGGKSLTLAGMRPDITVMAADVSRQRLSFLAAAKSNLGLNNIRLFSADARHSPLRSNAVDLVLLDAPCTACGTLRKNPDLKNKITPALIQRNAELQRQMLQALAAGFPGRQLLYSVCSFLPAETEELIANIADETAAVAVDISPWLAKYEFLFRQGKHGCYLLPSTLNNDLFYISLLRFPSPKGQTHKTISSSYGASING